VKGNNLYTVFYAAILGIVCALLLTVVSELTKPFRLANAKAAEIRNIFEALDISYEKKASASDLEEIYKANITEKEVAEGLVVFEYSKPEAKEKVLAAAIRIEGPGLWAPIKGFLALEPDLKTIKGIRFYKQEETPGLGGEIATDGFQNQFVGKSIYDSAGQPGIIIKSGASKAINGVDAISGATMTCDKVQDLVNAAIIEFAEVK
jgi:Na+-transporting NADH:ubiquinone oxidoreductase subunit C